MKANKHSAVTGTQKTDILRHLYFQLEAGIPIHVCLEKMAENRVAAEKQIVEEVLNSVIKGETLSQSLRSTGSFDSATCALVEVGEETGRLPGNLKMAVAWGDRAKNLRSKITSAFVYPSIVLLASLSMSYLLFRFLVPPFARMAADADAPLPLLSRVLFGLSKLLDNTLVWWIGLALILQALFFLRAQWKKPETKARIVSLCIYLPVVGAILRLSAQIRLLLALTTMIRAGGRLERAILQSGSATGMEPYAEWGRETVESVKQGGSLSVSLTGCSLFKSYVAALASVGEESGQLEETLERAAVLLEDDFEHSLSLFTSLIEPVLLLFSGFTVGLILLATFLPMYHVVGKI